MKIPKAIYVLLIIIIGFQWYNNRKLNRFEDQMKQEVKEHIASLRTDFKDLMTITDSIFLINEKLDSLEHGKVDSLINLASSNDKVIKQLQYRQYELNKEYQQVADRLDSLGNFADLPDL